MELDETCSKKMKLFAEDTTIHGVRHILRKDQPLISRVIWTIAFTAAAIACVYLIGISFERFFAFDVKTTTSVKVEEEIDFPAITICNENMISRRLVGGSPNMVASFTAVIIGNIEQYEKKLKQATRTCSYNASEYTDKLNTEGYKWFRQIGIVKVMGIFSMDSKKSVLKCWWKDRVEDCSHFFLNHMTDFGWCFTLNPSPKLLQGFELGIRVNDTGYGLKYDYSPLKLKSTGPNNGFKMLLDVHQDDYCVTRTDAAGFKVLIHDPNVQPTFFLERPLSLAPGFETSVSIRYTRHTKTTENLGRCNTFQPLYLFPHAKVYFKEACYMECYTNFIYNHCHCTPLYGPPRSNYRIAEFLGKSYVPVCWDRELAICMKRTERNFLDLGLSKLCGHCMDPCSFTIYDVQSSSAYFPGDNFRHLYYQYVNRSSDNITTFADIRKNLLLVNFYVESMQISEVTESQAFTADQLVADIGGQVGFLLGMSILSLFEFLQCFMPRKTPRKKLYKSYTVSRTSHKRLYSKRY